MPHIWNSRLISDTFSCHHIVRVAIYPISEAYGCLFDVGIVSYYFCFHQRMCCFKHGYDTKLSGDSAQSNVELCWGPLAAQFGLLKSEGILPSVIVELSHLRYHNL